MSRYDKYGPRDDQTLEDLDLGFLGFNNRMRPDQLPVGMLAECDNGRLDRTGSWQLRDGVDLIGTPIATGVDALTLPFYLLADDNTVTVTINGLVKASVAAEAVTFQGSYEANMMYHSTAFVLATAPLDRPKGAASAEVIAWENMFIRMVYDYDMDQRKMYYQQI